MSHAVLIILGKLHIQMRKICEQNSDNCFVDMNSKKHTSDRKINETKMS